MHEDPENPVYQMSTELILRHENAERLQHDFEANLRKGRAFVPGPPTLAERDFCMLCIEPPGGGTPHRLRAEAVWIDAGGIGVSFVDFDAERQDALRAFVEAAIAPRFETPPDTESAGDPSKVDSEPAPDSGSVATPTARHLHDRIRELDLAGRDAVARQGSLPERVALERRYGSSVWEGLLHNPQITPREVRNMAKSTSLTTGLVNLIVVNRTWLADASINQALLNNPRVSGTHLERVLRVLSQPDIARIAEQSSLRIQVRQAAKRLIRR
jgi:hypothetical protein